MDEYAIYQNILDASEPIAESLTFISGDWITVDITTNNRCVQTRQCIAKSITLNPIFKENLETLCAAIHYTVSGNGAVSDQRVTSAKLWLHMQRPFHSRCEVQYVKLGDNPCYSSQSNLRPQMDKTTGNPMSYPVMP